jgi:fructoselysine-6-P-deglycase FrlB-like protein
VTLTLAIMAFVSAELGIVSSDSIERAIQFRQEDLACMHSAVELLCKQDHIIVTGRSLFSALAQLFCLGSEELGGKPIVYNETGQLHHGPLEVLSAKTALVVFRQKGILGELAKSFEDIQKKTGCSLVVIDSSGLEPLKNSLTITCPTGEDIVASLAVMETFQSLMIAYACSKNEMAGIPKYSTKIATTE